MKLKFAIVIAACFAPFLFACKKQKAVKDNNLYGKWKLIEIYDKYGSGETNGWHDVTRDGLQQIEFTLNGGYKKTENIGATSRQCSGTYKMPAQNKVEINSTCDPAIESLTISELTNETLITDQIGTEGIIRFKYIPCR